MGSYWADRVANAQAKITKKNAREVEKELVKQYNSTFQKVVGSFEKTYWKIFQRILDVKEITPADLYKLDTYWELQGQLKNELQKLGDKQIATLNKRFTKQYTDIYESFAMPGESFFNTLDTEAAKQVIKQIWCADGKTWDSRIWGNIDELQNALNENLVHCVAMGKKPSELKHLLMEQFEVAFNRADTVVRTEMAHIQTQAAAQRYKDNGIEEVEVWADKDERRCKQCGKLHKKRYPVGAQIPLPAHPNCRCCIVPVVEDIEEDEYNESQLEEIEKATHEINPNIGIPQKKSESITINDLGKHGKKRLEQRGITVEDAQCYINDAIISFKQGKDKILYLSDEGVCVMIKDGRIATAYPKEYYDENTIRILEVVKNGRK